MICDQCKEDKPDVQECDDPFAKEIYGEIVKMLLCNDCFQERCDDI